jgi:hypothetical protein
MDIVQLIDKLDKAAQELFDATQDPVLDSLSYAKAQKLKLRTAVHDLRAIKKVFLGAHLSSACPLSQSRQFTFLKEDFLRSPPGNIEEGSCFLLLNNDVAPNLNRYIEFYEANPQAIFIIWDWDSQHWIKMSCILAVHSDFYVSGTSENSYVLSQFNPFVLSPEYVGVHQWPKSFLFENIDVLLSKRVNGPFGKHVFYSKYPKRNRIIATVSRKFPEVCFSDNQFKTQSLLESLSEWASYKSHWIAPVLGGVPIRVYNALVSGGVPIIPSFYNNFPEGTQFSKNCVFYDITSVIEPDSVVRNAVEMFDSLTTSSRLDSIAWAIENFHIDYRIERILLSTEAQLDKLKS